MFRQYISCSIVYMRCLTWNHYYEVSIIISECASELPKNSNVHRWLIHLPNILEGTLGRNFRRLWTTICLVKASLEKGGGVSERWEHSISRQNYLYVSSRIIQCRDNQGFIKTQLPQIVLQSFPFLLRHLEDLKSYSGILDEERHWKSIFHILPLSKASLTIADTFMGIVF